MTLADEMRTKSDEELDDLCQDGRPNCFHQLPMTPDVCVTCQARRERKRRRDGVTP